MPTADARHDISIRRWAGVADKERLIPALDAIFFEASATKSFAGEAERQTFRERWLGRYLKHDAAWAYVAVDSDGVVAGYLVGSVNEPAAAARFDDIGRFEDCAALAAQYPAHLHVNLAPQYRNCGIGSELIAAFAADAAASGAPGVHVITGANSRNVAFYERNGFRALARASFNGHAIVCLGRRLSGQETA